MKSFFQKFNHKKFGMIAILAVVVFGFLLCPNLVRAADAAGVISTVLGWIILPIVTLLGKLLTVVIRLLVSVAQYNDFINATAVTIGWVIIRDICNMFFIVILLVIAFCTVLRIEQYSYKRLLSSLIIAAVIVNFSKLICGVIIDFSQVIMLTFVNAFKSAAEGNFATMLGLDKIMALRSKVDTTESITGLETIGALILGLIISIVALVVVTVMTIILFFRIVVLWFCVLLSPFAFVASVLPQTSRYSSMWWDKFTNQVIVGPVMAFFIWLSLAVVQQSWQSAGGSENLKMITLPTEVEQNLGAATQTELATQAQGGGKLTAAITKIGEGNYILNFVIGIAMLIGSLMAAQQLGVAGSQMAGRAINQLQKWGAGAVKLPIGLAGRGVRAAGQSMIERAEGRIGIPLQPKHWKEAWESRKRVTRAEREAKMIEKARARGIPTANELVNSVTSIKGNINLAKRLFGRAKPLRDKEKDLGEDIKSVEQIIAIESRKKSLELKQVDLNEELKTAPPEKISDIQKQISEIEKEIPALDKQIIAIEEKLKFPIKEKAKIVQELQKLKDEKRVVHAKAEMINPTTMSYEDRLKITKIRYEEYQRLQGVEDAGELQEQYDLALAKGDTMKAQAIITKLTKNMDLNELLNTYKYKQNYQGIQDLIEEHFSKKLGMNDQMAYAFGNDITLMNKANAAYRFGGAFIRSPEGFLRKATEEDHQKFVLAESGKQDRERLWRAGFWGWAVGKETDPKTNQRVPIYDATTERLIVRDLDMILNEMNKGRFSPEFERNFSHPRFLNELKTLLSKYEGETKKDLQEVINNLEGKQAQYWGAQE